MITTAFRLLMIGLLLVAAAPPFAHPPGTAFLRSLTLTPAEQSIIQPKDEIELHFRASFSDGTTKDVSALTVFESTNPKFDVTRFGRVKSSEPGETTVVVRYLHLQAT